LHDPKGTSIPKATFASWLEVKGQFLGLNLPPTSRSHADYNQIRSACEREWV